ncbi:D-alanyl-D-alanine carboxypeptidase family protein [Streptomyces toxytricini]|uniref:D-alanyl-D-alanine carboxypeptidase family protein n=2 Tax=Streptomyces toxytricini TaxID=67369 RepID=A0ABW8EPF6_STRT5
MFRPRDPEDAAGAASGSVRERKAAEAEPAGESAEEPEAEAAGDADAPRADSSGRAESAAAEADAEAEAEDGDDADDESEESGESDGSDESDGSGDAETSADAPAVTEPAKAVGKAPAKTPAKAPAKPAAESDDADDNERTAVFRAPVFDSGSAEVRGAAGSGARPAGKSGGADAAAEGGAEKDAESAGGAGDSERTAVFRAPKFDSGSASATDAKPAAKTPAVSGNDDSERTAVFRAPRLDSGSGRASGPAAGAAGAAGRESAAAKSGDGAPEDSERTAVFRAVKPPAAEAGKASGSASAPAAAKPADGEPEDSERTAVFRAVKPPAAEAGKAAPAADKPVAERPVPPKSDGGEKASTFVPLRTDDGPAKPAAPARGPVPPPKAAAPKAAAPKAAAPKAAAPKAAAPKAAAPKAAAAGAAAAAAASAPASAASDRTERTTQQPLPPKPPLDMLADLTNNPPPPPTPMRTFVRRVKIYAPLVVLLAVILAVVQLVRPLPEPKLTMTAKKSYTFEGAAPALPWPKEGQAFMAASGLGTVGSFGEQKPIAIGSVAKTMTAYVILKNHPLKKGEQGPMIDVDKAAVEDGKKDAEGESTVNTLQEGGKISQYDALAAIMIPSANNVARLLARWDTGGDQEAFVKKMNDTAKELGMTNTTYTDPSGLDATTVSTAEDQVKLGLKVVEMPELVAITKLPSWQDPSGKVWRNWNDLVPYNGSLGIKTGSTSKAGGNLLFAAEKQVGKTRQLIVGAVLGQHGVPILGTAIAASKSVMLATQKSLTNAAVVKKGDVVGYVDDGLGGRTPVVAGADVEAVGWPSLTVDIKLSHGDSKLPQTATAGTEVGVLTVGEGASQVKVPVTLKSDLAAPGIGSKLTRIG